VNGLFFPLYHFQKDSCFTVFFNESHYLPEYHAFIILWISDMIFRSELYSSCCVNKKKTDIWIFNCLYGPHNRINSISHSPFLFTQPGSINEEKIVLKFVISVYIESRVVRRQDLQYSFFPRSEFTRDDFPTLGRPTIAILGRSGWPEFFHGQVLYNLIEQFACSAAVHRT